MEFDQEFEENIEVVEVKVVRRSGSAVLVEWIEWGQYKRTTVPLSQIDLDMSTKTGLVEEGTLDLGIPYGIPWEEIIGEIKITPELIANVLRQYGLWTLKDIEERPNSVIGALQATYGLDLATLLRGARIMKEK